MGTLSLCTMSPYFFLPVSLFPMPLSWGTISVMKHHDQKQLGEERVYLTYSSTSLFIIERSQDRSSHKEGTWTQELMQRPWRGAAYWLAS